jgi:glycosyltransferase involved in cell wall biosynthesis
MRVLYITQPSLLDVSLSFIKAISPLVDMEMIMQITRNSWRSSIFEKHPVELLPDLSPADPIMNEFPPHLRESWKAVKVFKLASFPGSSGINPGSIRTGLSVLQYAAKYKPDIIHLETTSGRLLWTLLFLRKMAPLIITVHDPHPHSGESPLRKRIIRSYTYRIGDRYILHNMAQINQFCREYGVDPRKVAYTPLGEYSIYRGYLDLLSPVNPNMVLFFGRLSPYKGIETLFQAAPLVCNELPDIRFVVAGRPIPGYKIPQVPELSNNGKLEIIQEYIPNDRLAELFQQAALIVCPYTDATQSGVVMTAYGFWKPVIATRVGGLPEYIEDGLTGKLVEPKDPVDLANSIVAWINKLQTGDGQLKTANAIQKICNEKFNWERIASQTLDIYQRAIEERRRRHSK